ncbi:MAG TPA: hypothetical protein VGG38_11185 [Acidimicrobiales bacterium]
MLHEIAGTIDKTGSHVKRAAMVVGHAVRTHPLQTVTIIAGGNALAIPGVDVLGAELDVETIRSLEASDFGSSAAAQTVKGIAGSIAIAGDADQCAQGAAVSCASALVGGYGLYGQNQAAEAIGYALSLAGLALP